MRATLITISQGGPSARRKGRRVSSRLWRVFLISVAYAGAVIGAGFVSGREVVQFFAVHGGRGLAGAALATLAFAGLGAAAAYLSRLSGRHDYRDLVVHVSGPRLGEGFSVLMTLTLASALAIMLAGGGALAHQQLGWDYTAGTAATSSVIVLILVSDLRGLLWVNGVLVPLLLSGQLAVAIATLRASPIPLARLVNISPAAAGLPWWLMALLYAGYNLVVGLSILPPATRRAKSPGEAAFAALAGGLVLGFCALATTALSLALWPTVAGVDIPTAYAVAQRWPGRQGLVSVALWLAMVMSGTANAYGLGTRLAKLLRGPINRWAVAAVVICLPVTKLGFARAIAILYPMAGAGGLAVIIVAVIRRFKAGRWPAS